MSVHWRTAFGHMRRSPFQALAAISVLTLTFFIATIFAVLIFASNQVLTHFETRPQIITFIQNDATVEEISVLQRNLDADPRVNEVTYVTKEQAFDIYKEATVDNPLLAELVSPTIFPASLEFSVNDLSFAKEVMDELGDQRIVESVGFTASIGSESNLGDVIERLKTIILYIRIGGVSLAATLALSSFLVLMVVIGMRIATRKSEIEALDLIGATAGFIRAPIVIEAINYAVIGVVFGWTIALILVLYATPTIISYFGAIPVLPKQTPDFFILLGVILAAELVMGLLIALFGSLVAVSRARKK